MAPPVGVLAKTVALGAFTLGTLGSSFLPSRRPFFDLEEGITMAEYAAASYCPAETIGNWTCERCVGRIDGFVPTAVVHDPAWNLQAYVGFEPGRGLLVVFRGTVEGSLENWIHNVMTTRTKVKFPGMPKNAKVHDGFYRSWTRSTLKKEIVEAVRAELHARDAEREDDSPTTVTVVGHSLGGALATLCATDLVTEENITSVRLYTFGCPRVGNEAFARALQNTTLVHTRVTHDRDVVPTLPFRHLGFHHTAREVWQRTLRIGRSSMSLSVEIICDGSGEDMFCQNSLCSVPGKCSKIADHLEYLGVSLGGDADREC
jgi:hypothetical protein